MSRTVTVMRDAVEHAERVDAHDADCAVGLLVELDGEVGRHAGNVEIAGSHARHELVCRRGDRELVGWFLALVGKRVLFHIRLASR